MREVKSGYGLDLESELLMLRVGRRLGEGLPVSVVTTLLAAHTLPPEYRGEREAYLELVCDVIIPRAMAEGLVDAVDAFCEGIAFTSDECGRVFETARRFGLPIRIHADQLSDGGGAALAARFEALSADHLEHASRSGLEAMAASGTIAVLLPGAFYFLREQKAPPVAVIRELGVAMAVATDCNPGTSPLTSILLAMNLACTQFGLHPEEALAGTTREAARVLGLGGDRGTLEPGKRADFAIWDVGHPRELAYWIGGRPLLGAVLEGVPRVGD